MVYTDYLYGSFNEVFLIFAMFLIIFSNLHLYQRMVLMNIYKILISTMIIISSPALLTAEIVILKDWTAIKGSSVSGDEKILSLTEVQSNKKITIKRSEIQHVIEENLLDKDTINNYRTINWKEFDFKKLEEKKQELQRKKTEEASSFTANYMPRAGITVGLSFATGEVGSALDKGFSLMMFNDYLIPVKTPVASTGLRAGLMLGYSAYSSVVTDFAADITLIPVLVYGDISYRAEIGLAPYFRIGTGITSTTLTDNSGNAVKQNASSIDGTLLIGLGTGYINENLPSVEFFIDFSYLMVFEKVTGNFINMSFGAAYHFYTAR